MRPLKTLAVLFVLGSCGGAPPAGMLDSSPPAPENAAAEGQSELDQALVAATAGVENPELAELLREHWAWVLEQQPLRATRLGVHRYDDRIADQSYDAIQKRRAFTGELLRRAKAITRLSEQDLVTHALFVEALEVSVASFVCDFYQWSLSPRGNPVTEHNHLHEIHKITTAASGQQLLERYRQAARSIDVDIENLRRGAGRGLYATSESTRRVLKMVKKQLAQETEDWPMLKPVAEAHEDWEARDLEAFRAGLRAVVDDGIKPALERYAEFIEKSILPNTRSDEDSGLRALPEIGGPCYDARIRAHTTLKLTPKEIHEIGLREVERIDKELTELGTKALGTTTLVDTLAKLRSDKSLYFGSEDEVANAAQSALDDAKAKMGDYFGILPKTDCIIRRIPAYEAPYTTIAYYRPPHADGSKPGEYFVNVYQPQPRPRFEARVLAVHEAIPGHHLQIAIAQEMAALPAFRKHGGVTAYVEGWALYTERLGEEMGLYRDDLDRIGVASFDAWRAGRLVVDTGIHAMGWSRGRAKDFLERHSALSPENIDNEVDRYIVWPGQALAYKLGQLEIRRLRAEAEQKLGDKFSLPAFHDAVLSLGAVTLPVLRARIESYVGENIHR
jgi:uncharacterized protein (DUF885 family)